jgi:tetratricopeptide (TPR) repeat protein
LIFRRGLPPEATYSFKHALVRDAAYAGLLMSTRRGLHSKIARVLRDRFPERAASEPESLAQHFTEAGELFEAIKYWLIAGRRAAERSANVEAVAHLRHGLTLIELLPKTVETERLELAVQSALGMPLKATKGYSAIETGATYDRARELCEKVGTTSQLFPILYGQGVFRLDRGEFREGLKAFEEYVRLAVGEDAEGPALVGRRMLGTSHFISGDLCDARKHLEQALATYDSRRHSALTFQYGADQRSAALAWLGLDLCVLGFPAQAKETGDKAIALAKDSSHALTLAHALRIGGCYLSAVQRDLDRARDHAAALKDYAAQQRMPYWGDEAEFILAWSSLPSTQTQNHTSQMHTILAESKAIGLVNKPFLFTLLADAYRQAGQPASALSALAEALAVLKNQDEYWWAAEIYRLQGQMRLSLNSDNAAAEACYKNAIGLARRQSGKWLELRAVTNLAQLWHSEGRCEEARSQLAPVYGWFAEGFDTPDLIDARAMLDELEEAL